MAVGRVLVKQISMASIAAFAFFGLAEEFADDVVGVESHRTFRLPA